MRTLTKNLLRTSIVLCGLLLAVFTTPVLAQSYLVTMEIETETLDLESGTVATKDPGELHAYPSDLHLSYNADRTNPIVLFQNQMMEVEIAFLENTPFASVSETVLTNLVLTRDTIDLPLDPDDTVIIATPDGNIFKVGNALNMSDGTVALEVLQLQ